MGSLVLLREEIAIRDIGKIYSYSAKIPIKNQLDKWKRKETTDRHISPLGLMCLQGEEMKKETAMLRFYCYLPDILMSY
jgi:hypothetical protein